MHDPKIMIGNRMRMTIRLDQAWTRGREGVGQLHIYERLLGGSYRKVLVVQEGMAKALGAPPVGLSVDVECRRQGRRIFFDAVALAACLKIQPADRRMI